MKILLLINLYLFFYFNLSSQITDTSCIKSRWIVIKNSKINKELFTQRNDSIGILSELRDLVDDNKIIIYDEVRNYQNKSEWVPISNEIDSSSNIDSASVFTILTHWSKTIPSICKVDTTVYNSSINRRGCYNGYSLAQNRGIKISLERFQTIFIQTTPLPSWCGEDSVINNTYPYPTVSIHYGEDSVINNTKQALISYVYPPPDTIIFSLSDITEIRIKEDRIFNSKLNRYEFEPVWICFYASIYRYSEQDLFWVNFKDLSENIKDVNNQEWCNLIKNKKYDGFQYYQTSCYDDKVKY